MSVTSVLTSLFSSTSIFSKGIVRSQMLCKIFNVPVLGKNGPEIPAAATNNSWVFVWRIEKNLIRKQSVTAVLKQELFQGRYFFQKNS